MPSGLLTSFSLGQCVTVQSLPPTTGIVLRLRELNIHEGLTFIIVLKTQNGTGINVDRCRVFLNRAIADLILVEPKT